VYEQLIDITSDLGFKTKFFTIFFQVLEPALMKRAFISQRALLRKLLPFPNLTFLNLNMLDVVGQKLNTEIN
jgi:hypothetical protein